MNYLWEVLLQAEQQGIWKNQIRFCRPRLFSAYMEVSNTYINQVQLDHQQHIEVNPYYRFYKIFKDLYLPELELSEELQDSLTNLILHQLAENDVLSGMTKEEFYKQLLMRDVTEGKFGSFVRESLFIFDIDERQLVLSGMLRQYETGCSMNLFKEMVYALIPDNIVYHNNQKQSQILIYIARKRGDEIEQKIAFLITMFLNMQAKAEIYYEYHFGIIGVDETMIIDEIAIC